MSKLGFDKFINKKSAGKIKEEHRQEKRKSKAALRAAGDEMRRQKLEKQRGNTQYREERDLENFRGGKSFKERRGSDRSYGTQQSGESRGFRGKGGPKTDRFEKGRIDRNAPGERPRQAGFKEDFRDSAAERDSRDNRNNRNTRYDSRRNNESSRERGGKGPARFDRDKNRTEDPQNPFDKHKDLVADDGTMPLNKYIAHAGVCGRREAAEMVKLGQVQVNGDIVFEPATKVTEKDVVKLKGKKLTLQIKHFYFLLNKPKDHITTTKDEKGRKTVLDLFKDVEQAKHLYPVGRLDRNTTGVLLITNDGELAQQLTHPSFEVKKIYEATLDRPVAKKDLEAIAGGITLEDGDIKADQVGYPDAKDKSIVGIEIHSGKNRIVRRIFEHLGYEVKKLDRVMFAGLTKKNVERGKWRYLSEKEVRILKFMNAGGTKKSKKAAQAAAEQEPAIPEVSAPIKKAKRARISSDPKKATDGGRDRDHMGPLRKQATHGAADSKTTISRAKPAEKRQGKPSRKTPGSSTGRPVGKTTRKEKH